MKSKSAVLILTLFAAAGILRAQSAASSFVPGTPQDETAIRKIMADRADDKSNPHVAADLDWENAFGVRYTNLQKQNAFYGEVVTPQFASASNSTIETKIKFLTPDIAVSDEYWHVAGQTDYKTGKPGADRWGRTTYIFKKENGQWTEVLERVADLRVPYYKHYDALPKPVPVPAATLNSYAGAYNRDTGAKGADVAMAGDHLQIVTKRGTKVMVPTSETEFLAFNPDDLEDYQKIVFGKDAAGKTTLTMSFPEGSVVGTLTKAQ